MKKITMTLGIFFALTGCVSADPQATLDKMAVALDKREGNTFLQYMDMQRFAAAQVQSMTENNTPLHALDSVGKFLGLGGVGDFLGTVLDVQKDSTEHFMRGVSTGELINTCTRAQEPNCPWVPDSLRAAKVKELSPTSAVAQITTPAGMTSWLVLAKEQEMWKVVGQAVLESEAVALTTQKTQPSPKISNTSPEQGKDSDPYAPAPPPSSSPSAPAKPYVEDAPAPPPVTKL